MIEQENYIKNSHEFNRYCKEGNLHAVHGMINKQIEFNIHMKDDYALRKACQYGHIEIVKLLLSSPNLKEHSNIHANSDEALKLACENGHIEVAKFLLTSPLIKQHSDSRKDNDVCLRKACINGHLEIIKLLCSFSPHFSQCHIANIHEKVFLELCENNNIEMIKYIYNNAIVINNAQNHLTVHTASSEKLKMYNHTAIEGLTLACENNHLEVVEYLLVNMNFEDIYTYKKKLPLMIRLTIGSLQDTSSIVKFLLTSDKLKENIDISFNNECFLRHACISRKYDLVRYLTTSPELTKHSDIQAPNLHYIDGLESKVENALFIRALRVKDKELLKIFIFELDFPYDQKKEHIIKHYNAIKTEMDIIEEVEHMFNIKQCNDKLNESLIDHNLNNKIKVKI
jgi:ankyrin repeat protein